MAIRVKLDHLLLDRRLTLTELATASASPSRTSRSARRTRRALFASPPSKRFAASSSASQGICWSGHGTAELKNARRRAARCVQTKVLVRSNQNCFASRRLSRRDQNQCPTMPPRALPSRRHRLHRDFCLHGGYRGADVCGDRCADADRRALLGSNTSSSALHRSRRTSRRPCRRRSITARAPSRIDLFSIADLKVGTTARRPKVALRLRGRPEGRHYV